MCNCPGVRAFRFGVTIAVLTALFTVGSRESQVAAATYYVRASGTDSNSGLAPATAFRTLAKAATVVTSGDTVYVGAGTYSNAASFSGVQQSNAKLTLVADRLGNFTGDAGAVTLSNSTITVVNCNFVEFHAFQFQGATNRLLVWKGSYAGLFQDCVFTGGGEPLLIKDGSVRFEECQLTNFASDAIYVDGEAVVELVDSSISNCQGDGVEIAKTARVTINGTRIENNLGDGVRVAQTSTYIDDGVVVTGSITERLAAGKFRIVASQGSIDGYDSSYGSYGGGNSGLDINLYGNALVSASASVPVKGNVFHGPTGSASVPNLTGTISPLSSNFALDAIDIGDAATNNNNANIPLTDYGLNPYSGGNLILASGDGLSLPPGTYYFSQLTISGGAVLRITGPTTIYVTFRLTLTGGSIVNPSQKPSDLKFMVTGSLVTLSGSAALQAAIYAPDARVSLSGSTAIYGMVVANEVIANSTGGIHLDRALTTYAAGIQGLLPAGSTPAPPTGWVAVSEATLNVDDSTIQGNRRGVNLETAQKFGATNSSFNNNTEWGICLNGPTAIAVCTISGNGIGGLSLKACNSSDLTCKLLTISNNPQYGMYLEDCQVTFDATMLDQDTFTSASDYLIASQGGSLTLDGITLSGGNVAGVYASGGALIVRNSTLTGNGYGVGADQGTLEVANCTLSGNTNGLYSRQNTMLSVTSSTLNNNTAWGAAVSLASTTGATVTFSGSTLSGNAGGIGFIDTANCTIQLPNTAINNNSGHGLSFENSNVTLNAAATSGWQLTNNAFGINSLNSTLTLDGLTLSGNTAAAVYAVGGNLSISNSTLSSGVDAVAVSNSGTVSINACNLSGGTAGLNANQNADVAVVNSNFTGSQYGLWGTNNTQLVVDASMFTGNSLYGAYLAGNGSLRDCTMTSNGSGLYLNAANITDANLTGTDIYGNSSYGVYVYAGSLALSSQTTEGWSIDSNGSNIGSYQASISLTNASLTNATTYGVYSQFGSVNIQQSTIESNSRGVWCIDADSFTIDRSHISGTSAGSWVVFNYDSGLVMRNTIVSGSLYGVYSYGTTKNAMVYNSTIVDALQYGIYADGGDLTVMNTIIFGDGGSYGLYRQPSANVTHTHNLVYGFATPFANAAADPTELLEQPRFADVASGDYRLAKGSPAINAGADLSSSHTVDMQGNARPSHKVFEIGAYEYMPDGGSLRILDWKETR